jgi:hypothetical protein
MDSCGQPDSHLRHEFSGKPARREPTWQSPPLSGPSPQPHNQSCHHLPSRWLPSVGAEYNIGAGDEVGGGGVFVVRGEVSTEGKSSGLGVGGTCRPEIEAEVGSIEGEGPDVELLADGCCWPREA